jgi:pyruvate dehydrogenase E2 component (dihydrolipoamide acetyltransferase)
MLEVTLPALPGGAAKVLRWLAAEGADVAQGAPLVVVLTEHVEAAVLAPANGVLAILAAEGTHADTGAPLARLAQQPPAPAAQTRRPKLKATPLARTIALAHEVALDSLTGTGPHGQIRAADVRATLQPHPEAIPAPTPPLLHSSTPPLLHSSTPPLPHPLPPIATAAVEFDAGAMMSRAAEHDLAACVVEAVAAILPGHPALNGRWGEEALVLRRRQHIAVAVPGGEGGLRWALVRDAGDLKLRGVARALGACAACDRAEATFAVVCTAPGAGWQSAHPPLPGTSAALSVGAPALRAVVAGDAVAVRPVASLTVSYDARMLDHRAAAAFLGAVKARLERPL